MNKNETRTVWQQRTILLVFYVLTAFWRAMRQDCVIPGIEIIVDQAFEIRYMAFLGATVLLFLFDMLPMFSVFTKRGYEFTRISRAANLFLITITAYQTFFAPPESWYG